MMQEREGNSPGADAWREATSRALAVLAPFSQVRLTLRLPPDAFDSSLYRDLPLRDDERLLAVIDCGPGNAGFCALTTHRIYWPAGEEGSIGGREGGSRPQASAADVPQGREGEGLATTSLMASAGMEGSASDANGSANGHAPNGHWVDYGALPGDSGQVPDSDRLDLGGGQILTLRGADPRLIPALGRYLAIMAAGASGSRASTVPEEAVASPGRPRNGVLAAIAIRSRMAPADLDEFRRALDAASRLVVVTPIMIAACVVVFAVMVISGVPIFRPSSTQLIDWGANDGARVMLRHEYWRLATSVFIHAGLIHLAVNLWSLIVIGPLMERIYGPPAFAAIYLSSGIGGAIASAVIPPVRPSVGASGAICGVLGALMAFLILHHRTIPPSVLKLFRDNLVGIVAFMAVLGVVVPNIDHSAHIGGLITGFVSGLLLSRPWPVVPGGRTIARRLAMIAAIAAGLAGTAIVASRLGQTFVPPARRLADFLDQILPPYRECLTMMQAAAEVEKAADYDRDLTDREGTTQATGELAGRGTANLDRLRRAATTDPELQAMAETLVRAQVGEINWTKALGRYFETLDLAHLADAHDARALTNRSMRDFERLLEAYRTRHDLPVFRVHWNP